MSLWLYTALALVAVAALKFEADVIVRFYVTTFIPLALALAIGRSGAYRPGPADSLGRMLMQWLPLLALYSALALAYGRPRAWVDRLARRMTTSRKTATTGASAEKR